VEDRFGDSGLTGVLIAIEQNGAMRVDTWLMSCRVLGRKLDVVMWAALLANARARGSTRIEAEYLPTPKNGLVSDLYPQLGLELVESGEQRHLYATNPQMDSLSAPAYITVTDANA